MGGGAKVRILALGRVERVVADEKERHVERRRDVLRTALD